MPAIHVISAFGGLVDYIEAVTAEGDANRQALFRRWVLDPLWDRCVAGSELEDRGPALLDASAGDIAQLAAAVPLVEQSGVLHHIADAFSRSATYWPGPDTTIGLFPLDPGNTFVVEQLHGVLGWAPGAGKIIVLVTPQGDWLDWVPYTVAHEYHHCTWRWRHPGQGDFSLLEALIFEGRADSFALHLYPGVAPPCTAPLSREDEQLLWRRLRHQLHSRDRAVVFPLLVGGDGLPLSAGYVVGYRIVQAYLRAHPQVPVEVWSMLEPEHLLRESGYGEWTA